jgi:SAM-dependent methyltransferase
MIKQAAQMTNNSNVTFRQSGAEDLGFIPDSSVDMVVSGQAAHWFDYARVWPELARVVKRGGSLAFWGYRDNVLVGHKHANEIFLKFCYGEGEIEPGLEGMNKYWERPGRDLVRNLLRDVEPPKSDWNDARRILCDVKTDITTLPDPEDAWLQQKITLGGLEGYLHTFSAVQGWKDAHPEMKSRAEGGQGDLVDILMDRIVESEPRWKALGEHWRDAEVDTVWGTYILLARRS